MNKSCKNLFFSILFACTLSLNASNPVSVPVGHPVYKFIERQETLGIIENIRIAVKPFSRGHIAEILLTINSRRDKLTQTDIDKLDNYLLDFRYEIYPENRYKELGEGETWYSPLRNWQTFKKDFRRFFLRVHPEEENHALLWEEGGNSFYLDFLENFTSDFLDDEEDDKLRYMHGQRYKGYGTLNHNFGYAFDVSLLFVRGDTLFRGADPVLKGAWFKDQDGIVMFDRTGAEIAYSFPYVTATFAQQPVYWGVGESGSLLLSDYAEQYPYLGLRADWNWGSFHFLHGKLLDDESTSDLAGQPYVPDKYIAAHRLEISALPWLDFGFTEAIIYGNRNMDWAYMLPLNFYRAAEHGLEDRDNKIISLDFDANPVAGYRVYGSILLDEFKRSKIGTDWYGNKHAFMSGIKIIDPVDIPNLNLTVEYTAIMPWVYTHKITYNKYTTSDRSLGYWSGPNSQVIYGHINKEWNYRFETGLKLRQFKHGENYQNENIGGDIGTGYNILFGTQSEPRKTRKFLEGNLNLRNEAELYLKYEPFNGLYLTMSYTLRNIDYLDKNIQQSQYHFGLKFDY